MGTAQWYIRKPRLLGRELTTAESCEWTHHCPGNMAVICASGPGPMAWVELAEPL